MPTDLTGNPARSNAGLVDVLDRVLDKGLVVAGDIKVSLAEVELLTIRIRLMICSIDKAEEIGLDWWKYDRHLSPGREQVMQENLELAGAAPAARASGRRADAQPPAVGAASATTSQDMTDSKEFRHGRRTCSRRDKSHRRPRPRPRQGHRHRCLGARLAGRHRPDHRRGARRRGVDRHLL